MKSIVRRLLLAVSVPLCGAIRYATTMAVVCCAWWYDAKYLNSAFDANLSLIKTAGGFVDESGRVEAALRAFSTEKMLLFAEISAIVWLAGRIGLVVLGLVFRRRHRADEAPVGNVGQRGPVAAASPGRRGVSSPR